MQQNIIRIDNYLIQEIMTLTNVKIKAKAIRLALLEYINKKRRERLKNMGGTFNFNYTNKDLENMRRE